MEIISSTLALSAVQAELPEVAASAAPDARATARFAEIMQAEPPTTPTASAAPSPASLPPTAAPPGAAPTIGERILGGLNGLSTDYQESWKNVSAVLDGGNQMNTADMLKLQMSLTQMSIQYDMFGKVISRSTQNIEQLVKIQ